MSNPLRIGSVLRELRTEKGLTLKQLADMASVSSAYLSKLENEKVSPSIHTLKRVADCLAVPLTEFFENDLAEDPCINPPETWATTAVTGCDANVKQMVKFAANKKMQPLFTIVPPHGGGTKNHFDHLGEEFIYVLEGCLTLNLDGESTELTAGTLAYFSAMLPHSWLNKSEEPCKMIWVCSPPNW